MANDCCGTMRVVSKDNGDGCKVTRVIRPGGVE